MGLPFLKTNSSNDSTAPSESAVIKALEVKVRQLEEELEKKNSVIQNLEGSCLDKLDADLSSRTEDTLSDSSSGSGSCGTTTRSHGFVVEQLSAQLEDRTQTIVNLQNQLKEKSLLTAHLQERLNVAEQAKQTLVTHMTSLEKKIFDQENEIECLQDLNETNSEIVSEMENPNQWRMYQKLQSLMDTNNKLSQQLAKTTTEKQEALQKVSNLEKEQLNLYEQMDALKDLLKRQSHKLDRIQVETQSDFPTMEENDQDQSNSVLPEIQQVIDIFSSSCTGGLDFQSAQQQEKDDASSSGNTAEDPKLLYLSLLNCQAQLKQMQKNQELQLQKSVRQSLLLAESKATVDTLSAKVEHYEAIMDDIIAQHNAAKAKTNNNNSTNNNNNCSKAAKELMANDDLGPSLQFGNETSPPNIYSVRNNDTGARTGINLPSFMTKPKPRATLIRQDSEYIEFEDMEDADACSTTSTTD